MDYKPMGITLGVCCGALATYYLIKSRRQMKWTKVGEVGQLFIHPVKSCRGVEVQEAESTPLGLRQGNLRDRILMLVDAEDPKKFITAREEPKMVLIKTKIDAKNFLTLSFPEKNEFHLNLNEVAAKKIIVDGSLWNENPIQGYDCGIEVADWICECLGKSKGAFKLIFKGDDLAPRFVKFDKAWANNKTVKKTDESAYGDLTGYLMLSDASLADLNCHFTDEKFSIRNFRPNIVATNCRKPFDEDSWHFIRIGESVIFENVKPCTRCVLTTIDPETGEKNPRTEPLKTLRSYRKCDEKDRKLFGYSPLFGINLSLEIPGPIRVGDPIYAVYY